MRHWIQFSTLTLTTILHPPAWAEIYRLIVNYWAIIYFCWHNQSCWFSWNVILRALQLIDSRIINQKVVPRNKNDQKLYCMHVLIKQNLTTCNTNVDLYIVSLNSIYFQISTYTWQNTSIQIHGKWIRKQVT